MSDTLIWFEKLRRGDVPKVGGKNASLGEMIATLGAKGIRVPAGFATTADAYRRYIAANGLADLITERMAALEDHRATLQQVGAEIRQAIASGEWPEEMAEDIRAAYHELAKRAGGKGLPAVAVRSSATAEDLPDASFAGQQETFLNIEGEVQLLSACRRCFASLFTDRAITYRQLKGFDHMDVALSVGVQLMVRSDIGASGVMFSLDTETGCDRFVLIDAAWGLGENVVQGAVDPDEYQVFKPFLDRPETTPIVAKSLGAKEIKMIYGAPGEARTRNVATSKAERGRFVLEDAEILELARFAKTIEAHYGMPMDMEWARDGNSGLLYIVQARPETVQSRREAGALMTYDVKPAGPILIEGLSVGNAAAAGRVCLIEDVADIAHFVDGSVLVTSNTDPDWVPIMKRASAIVTDHGGRTSHAAIVSRELGIPAVVGTGKATHVLHDGQDLTVSCVEGEKGFVYAGLAEITSTEVDFTDVPETKTDVMVNVANPTTAVRWWRLPVAGVGLARMEFLISNEIKLHPLALLRYDEVNDPEVKAQIDVLTKGHSSREEYFIDKLAMGLSRIAGVWYPKPVIIRMSDFKSNEYAALIGGRPVRAEGRKPDDRAARRGALLFRSLPRWLCAGMQGDQAAAGGDGLRQRGRDDPVLPLARRGRQGAGGDGRERAEARRERACRST